MAEPLTLTVEQAGQLLGVSRGVAYEAVRRGEIPSIRIGRRLLVPRRRLEQMLGVLNDEAPAAMPALRETLVDPAGGEGDHTNQGGDRGGG